mgnify:CR=1 FL=1
MFPEVTLTETTREDVGRMAEWLNDAEVNAMWYGLGDDGKPMHHGYSPHELFHGPSRLFLTATLCFCLDFSVCCLPFMPIT